MHRKNIISFDQKQNNNGDTYFYKDSLFQYLLNSKKEKIEKEFEEDIVFFQHIVFGDAIHIMQILKNIRIENLVR